VLRNNVLSFTRSVDEFMSLEKREGEMIMEGFNLPGFLSIKAADRALMLGLISEHEHSESLKKWVSNNHSEYFSDFMGRNLLFCERPGPGISSASIVQQHWRSLLFPAWNLASLAILQFPSIQLPQNTSTYNDFSEEVGLFDLKGLNAGLIYVENGRVLIVIYRGRRRGLNLTLRDMENEKDAWGKDARGNAYSRDIRFINRLLSTLSDEDVRKWLQKNRLVLQSIFR